MFKTALSHLLRDHYRNVFTVCLIILIFQISVRQNYLLFHTIVELFSIVVAFAVFIITWNARKMLDNNYLYFVGVAYLFVGGLDLLHTITFKGMNVIPGTVYYANQFWVATRFLEAMTLVLGFWFLNRKKILNGDLTFIVYTLVSVFIILTILYWKVFPICFVEGAGQTSFKIYAEYSIIALLFAAWYLLYKFRQSFGRSVFLYLSMSLFFTILSEFCFTLYISNYSFTNEMGHYAKLISFFLIYKANVETGFSKPAGLIFKNLKDNEEKYRTLAENLPEMIFRFDKDFKCLYSNSAVEKVLRHKSELYIGKDLRALGFPAAFESLLVETLLSVRQYKKSMEIDFDFTDGAKPYFFSIQIIPEYSTDILEETYLIIGYDITRLKVTEKRLRNLNATKDKFFSIIAHDLRNPFTALIAFSELIHKNAGKLSTEKIENLALRMNDSAKQAFGLLENLLNWSKIQTGALIPDPHPLEVSALLQEVKALCASSAMAKSIEIVLADDVDGIIWADKQMVNTVLRNLITNAIKFSNENSKISLSAAPQEDYMLFSVADTGVGISKNVVDELMEFGFKYTTNGTHDEIGTGLGLTLCKEFVEKSGGKIWLESELGRGTTFHFTIPFIQVICS